MKYFLLLIIFASCSSKKESPRRELARQQAELKREYKRLKDSADANPMKHTYGLSEKEADSIINAQGMHNRRMAALEIKSDSISNLMKKFELDSIANR